MLINFSDQDSKSIFSAMSQTIIPRPIAWVLSDNGDKSLNLAPFSFFNGVSSSPPLVSLSVGQKSDGSLKDTRRNIEQRNYFILHIPHIDQANLVTQSAKELPHGDSEIKELRLATIDVENFPLPRIRDCLDAFMCIREKIIDIEGANQALILGRVLSLFIDDNICQNDGGKTIIDVKKFNPLARIGGNDYAGVLVVLNM